MIVEDQTKVVSFLESVLSRDGEPVQTMETHISRIFLSGDRAYKMKRAVKLPYVDFSTCDKRWAACEKEVELNGPTAPGLYLGVRAITQAADGTLAIGGAGQTIETVVEMKRFDQSLLLDHVAQSGGLTPQMMTALAGAIVEFHHQAPIIRDRGGTEYVQAVLKINEAGFATSHVFTPTEVAELTASFNKRLAALGGSLDKRAMAGRVRRCHGDLHLRNIFLRDGRPCLFDCIEFSEEIATSDVLYDLAFLLMDLWHRGHAEFANLVMNRYLDETGDDNGFATLPFFMSMRAAVRAHVVATQAEGGGVHASELASEARSYFALAGRLLQSPQPSLVAIGGLSGSGKSTLAETLAPRIGLPPGARIIESDRIRKSLYDVPPETRLPQSAYRQEVSVRVYREISWRSRLILAQDGAVVADAVFDKVENRKLLEWAAKEKGCAFSGFWLEADPALLWQRIEARRDNVSDATVDILAEQLSRKLHPIDWVKLNAARRPTELADEILRRMASDEPALSCIAEDI
ncbi:AAA family ATPase [Rhizobium sp. P40RR-XXII]|uniref:bifunctional aminoglycoside phosphotransferase/ATP-binding protein n=1 Tax=Rhizobium sp. P40RR-XXII TaxID=2726739 RepID=UPI001456ACBB|nr:bifunctional aminoglycoside phosphotransferase/ATP-binding protein [Rhizobium sp. P40RR-XXII]NLS20400.1 AAA family ATPase [Rhizobium sp. P40RR-XXII]